MGRQLRSLDDPTHCPAGHLYDEENTRYERSRSGGHTRKCRMCDNDRHAAKRQERGLITPEERSRNGRYAMHVRWHAGHSIKPGCEFCS